MISSSACAGCRDNFYNQGGQRCWSAESGKMITRYRIHFMTRPDEPGAYTKVRAPSCYRQSNNYVFHNTLPSFVKAKDLNRANRKSA